MKLEVTPNTRKVAAVSILALCLSFCAILQIYHFTFKQPGYDFYNFWIYAQEFKKSDVANFYSIEFDKVVAQKYLRKALKEENHPGFRKAALWSSKLYEQGHVSAATPLFYASLATIFSGDYDIDLAIFQFTSTLIFCLTIYAIGRALGNGISTVLLTISFLLLFWAPFHNDTVVANLARIQTGLLGGCILIWRYFNHRPGFILGGLLLGISVLLKPNIVGVPVTLAIVWFFRNRYEKLLFVMLGAFLGGLISLTYSALYFGSLACWGNWFHALVGLQQHLFPVGRNLSLARLVEHYFGIDISIPILLGLLFSFILCCRLAKNKRVKRHADLPGNPLVEDLLGMGAGLIMIFMSFKVVWDHYLLLLAPVLLALISPIRNQTSEIKIEAPIPLLTGLLFFVYALLPLRLLVPTASGYDMAATIGIASLTFWVMLIFCLYQELIKG